MIDAAFAPSDRTRKRMRSVNIKVTDYATMVEGHEAELVAYIKASPVEANTTALDNL